MKTALKIAFLFVALAVMTACSVQKRAERRVRRAIIECPELVQVKAHPIDTVLTAPGFADRATLSLPTVLKGDTLYAATEHGTVVVSLCPSDSTLRVGFVAAPQEVRYRDTLRYAQVVVPEHTAKKTRTGWWAAIAWALGAGMGMALALYLLRYALKNQPKKHNRQ